MNDPHRKINSFHYDFHKKEFNWL